VAASLCWGEAAEGEIGSRISPPYNHGPSLDSEVAQRGAIL